MGTDNLTSRSNSTVIDANWFNQIRSAFLQDIVPRNSSGVATDNAGSLGSSVLVFISLFTRAIKLLGGTHFVTLQSPAGLTQDYTLKFPTAAPAFSQGLAFDSAGNGTFETIIPTGTVLPFAAASLPSGFLDCDGSSVSRTTYATLYAAIGIAHGTVDGNTFNLPDYRGRFLRGMDASSTRDPDRATRSAMNPNGNTGDKMGTVQADAFAAHTHTTFNTTSSATAGAGASAPSGSVASGSAGGSETRPINAYVKFIIKY